MVIKVPLRAGRVGDARTKQFPHEKFCADLQEDATDNGAREEQPLRNEDTQQSNETRRTRPQLAQVQDKSSFAQIR